MVAHNPRRIGAFDSRRGRIKLERRTGALNIEKQKIE